MASSKQAKLLKTLRTGRELTANQVRALGYSDPYSAIRNLREGQMVSVYANKRTVNGRTVTKYRIGTPTAAMMAAGFTA